MPTIIAFETSSYLASASLVVKGGAICTRYSSGVATHSQTLLPMVQALLAEAAVSMTDCDAIAFGCGPGSFTGVRTACGIAQGLAFGADLPLVPVVSLAAMAESCRMENKATDVLALMDARMGEVYLAQYRYENGLWRTVTEPCITGPETVVPHGMPAACGNGLTACADVLAGLSVAATYPEIMPDSTAVAALALSAYRRGETVSAFDAHPLYLRNKVAYTTEERRAMKAEKEAVPGNGLPV
ncbi:MAG: tRNA (adenosine(37)-N6)-threonylcarbamoyltransferase complex dimerization subunit type 1 TsaB [Alistipes senegalensis]|nr:tRNA (adenosine(37)-N6)-threonylcarbamoyltransferase complex dimerization subunit type 1 TsaB [Oxalobacter formigenes]MCM1281121.1 tRNA (adenosine(37)-N6)-threonylcarbamoyltransferase complex dimerization subunit type 1 TsaB [Alistipes senegalensis]